MDRHLKPIEFLKAEIEQLEGQRPVFKSRSYEEAHLISLAKTIYEILKDHDDRLKEIERRIFSPE